MRVLELDRVAAAMQREAVRTVPSEGFPALPDIPAARYADRDFFDLEMAAFRRTWLYGVHDSEIPEPGCFMRWEQLGEPLVFVRGQDGKVRCFYNICRHRANPVVTDRRGKMRGMMCPVHGWTYGLQGDLISLRDRRDFAGFDKSCRSLVEVRCEKFGALNFINLDGNAPPLSEFLGPFASEWQRYRPGNSTLISRAGMTVNANWKVVQEANMEVSHVTLVHPVIVERYIDYTATEITHFPNGHSIQATRTRQTKWTDSDVDLPGVAEVQALSKVANIAFNVFPNIVTPMNSWGHPLQTFWPIDAEHTYVENHWIGASPETPETAALWKELIETFDAVLLQDYQLCPATQKSVTSMGCRGLLMGCLDSAIYYMHQEMDRVIGLDHVPANLRVAPLLRAHVGGGPSARVAE